MSIPSSSSGGPFSWSPEEIANKLQALETFSLSQSKEKAHECASAVLTEMRGFSERTIDTSFKHAKTLLQFSEKSPELKKILREDTNFLILKQAISCYETFLESLGFSLDASFLDLAETLIETAKEGSNPAQAFLLELVKTNSPWASQHFFQLVEENHPWALHSLNEFTDILEKTPFVLDDCFNLTAKGHKETAAFFLPLLSSRFGILYHPVVTMHLSSKLLFQNANVFDYAIKLAEDNPVMQNLLSNEIFRNPLPFLSLLSEQFKNGSRMAEIYLRTLAAFDLMDQNSSLLAELFKAFDVANIPSSDINLFQSEAMDLARWFQGLHDYEQEGAYQAVENLPPMVVHKLLFANAMREAILLDLIVDRKAKDLPPSATHSCFPTVASWHIGSADHFQKGEVPEEEKNRVHYLFSHMEHIGRKYGIEIVSSSIYYKSPGSRNIPHSPTDTWGKDSKISASQGDIPTLRIPSPFSMGKVTYYGNSSIPPKEFSSGMFSEFCRVAKERRKNTRKIIFEGFMGQVEALSESIKAFSFAHHAKIPAVSNLISTEEGNHLVGNGFMIVGKDSFEVARQSTVLDMARLGYVKKGGVWEKIDKLFVLDGPDQEVSELSDEELSLLFARSYGIPPEHIYLCEQPAEYHLDTAMALIGDKKVMLCDSERGAEWMLENVQISESEEDQQKLKEFRETAKEKKEIEDKVQEELESLGFEVIRFGGKTYHPLEKYDVNLFNFLSATSPTPPHEKVIVAMGCSEEFQNRFRDFIQEHVSDVLPENIHFLDERWSHFYLHDQGGIRCMTCDHLTKWPPEDFF